MKRKLGWLALVVALVAPATMAWAGEGTTAGEHSCCCPWCCAKAGPK